MRTIRNSDPFRMDAARKLRKTMTYGERVFWNAVRNKALGFRVRTQYTVQKYIMDFYIHEARLCIEIDGPEHDPQKDQIRDGVLGDEGIYTIRIPWADIPGRLNFWLKEVKTLADVRATLQPERTRKDIEESKLEKNSLPCEAGEG